MLPNSYKFVLLVSHHDGSLTEKWVKCKESIYTVIFTAHLSSIGVKREKQGVYKPKPMR